MSFDPRGFVISQLIGIMPDELKKRLLQLQILKEHASSLGQMPDQLQSIENMNKMYKELGVEPSNGQPLGYFNPPR